jgi:hypothetical protein
LVYESLPALVILGVRDSLLPIAIGLVAGVGVISFLVWLGR